MPKVIASDEWAAIEAVIERHPAGVGVRGIRDALGFRLEPRTLQRRLKRLEKAGRIQNTGTGKGKRYLPQPIESCRVKETPDRLETRQHEIVLSEASREIHDHVCLPVSQRTSVGYDPKFLAAYVPNQSAYLSAAERRELARLGRVGVADLPAGTYLRQVLDRLLIDLSWNSSRLEGNTYSRLETERLLQLGESSEGHRAEETQMILNHKMAIEMLADCAGEIGFNRYTICNLHALLADNLLRDQAACGRVRSQAVGIGGSVYHPLAMPQMIEEEFLGILYKAEAITDPFEQAFFVMVHVPYLQPFEDVNKRVSRLAANIPLIKQNLCPLSFVDVPQKDYIQGLLGVYELNRIDYLKDVFLWAYQRSAGRYSAVLQTVGDPDPFRLRYRTQIGEEVRAVVTGMMDKSRAAKWIAAQANAAVPEEDRPRFIEVVETELSCLHEGNIARFRLRPGEYAAWRAAWQ